MFAPKRQNTHLSLHLPPQSGSVPLYGTRPQLRTTASYIAYADSDNSTYVPWIAFHNFDGSFSGTAISCTDRFVAPDMHYYSLAVQSGTDECAFSGYGAPHLGIFLSTQVETIEVIDVNPGPTITSAYVNGTVVVAFFNDTALFFHSFNGLKALLPKRGLSKIVLLEKPNSSTAVLVYSDSSTIWLAGLFQKTSLS